jgi:peptidyl-prolyl cis-trans isomerase SurA
MSGCRSEVRGRIVGPGQGPYIVAPEPSISQFSGIAVRRSFFALILLLLTGSGFATPAAGQSLVGIAATVNDDVITILDVATRTKLVILAGGLPNTPQLEALLQPHVLRILIDERLKIHAAELEGTSAPEDVVMERIAFVASRNNMNVEQFEAMLYRGGTLIETLRNQIRAELAWNDAIARRFNPGIRITGPLIDERLRRMEFGRQNAQYLASELLVASSQPGQDSEVRSAAESLLALIRNGVPFPLLAQQFSQAPSAVNDGLLGWQNSETLDAEIASAVANMTAGEFAGPIRTKNGYLLVHLMDKRQGEEIVSGVQVRLARMIVPVSSGASAAEVAEAEGLANSLRTQVTGCSEFEAFARQIDPVLNANPQLGFGLVSQLPPEVRPSIEAGEVDIATVAHRVTQGFEVFMICERLEGATLTPSRDQVQERLRTEALDEAALNYLAELRRSAIIQIRN